MLHTFCTDQSKGQYKWNPNPSPNTSTNLWHHLSLQVAGVFYSFDPSSKGTFILRTLDTVKCDMLVTCILHKCDVHMLKLHWYSQALVLSDARLQISSQHLFHWHAYLSVCVRCDYITVALAAHTYIYAACDVFVKLMSHLCHVISHALPVIAMLQCTYVKCT